MNTLNIALKDLQIFFRDRGAVVQLFLLPLVFIVVFSGALATVGGESEDALIPLPVVDLDGGQAAQALLQNLDAAGGVRIERYAQGQANALLKENEIARVLTVPADFSSGLEEGRQVTLRLVSHPDANPEETESVRLIIEGVAGDMALESQILASLRQMGEMQASEPEASRSFAVERMQAQARSQFERAQVQPLVAVAQTVPGQEAEREEIPDLDELAVPGFAVLFMFIMAQTTARSIYDEKKVGSFRRLLASPMSKASLLAGKMLPGLLMGILQAAVIFAFGVVGLRLLGLRAVTLGNSPLGVALVVVLIALCSSALGILIAAIARTENQIGGLSTLLLWGMGFVGGCVIPLVFLESFVGPLIRVVPHYWANRAFDHLMVRGLGLADVAIEMVVLLGFAVLFFAIGLWRFDFE
jgi:ABC-2 type transport system permease protein